MSRKFFYKFLICLCLFSIHCVRNFSVAPNINGTTRELTGIEKTLVESDNVFGFNLFKEIVKAETDTNIFISPLSVAMALGMTYNGASGNTAEEMRNTLGFSALSKQEINESFKSLIDLLINLDSKVTFQIANSIWYRNTFHVEQPFIDLSKTYFNALVQGLDFSSPDAPDVINKWVDDNTNSKIQKIIDKINPLTVMFLINAIYFKAMWTYSFNEDLTVDDLFTCSGGLIVPCKMMCQIDSLSYFETEDFQAVNLPYGNSKFRMTVLLPKPQHSVDSLIEELTIENWNQWSSMFSKTSLYLSLPKFKLEYEIKLNEVLKALGMENAFDPDLADFSLINKDQDIFISKVKHKTFIEVDEEGTEAAAVTVVEMELTSIGTDPKYTVMRVDRPFLFMIWENQSDTILFIGKIVSPNL